MKGIICYYSGSGNTKLACNYIKSKIQNANFELFNIVDKEVPNFDNYDIVGFATFTDFGAPPKYIYSYFGRISDQKGKNAFVFNTFGFMSGGTLKNLENLLETSGFNVVSGYSLHTPENYPPMRKRGKDFDHAPTTKELQEFNEYIKVLDKQIQELSQNKEIEKKKIKKTFSSLILKFSREKAKEDFGIQELKSELCTECGVCFNGCPYDAITMNPKPTFNHDICAGCWYCYNNCKNKAIVTHKFKGDFQYPKPIKQLKEKLEVNV